MDNTLIPLTEEQRTQLAKICDLTRRYNQGAIFAESIDHVALNLPDYPNVIKKPMDLATLRRKLLQHEYLNLQDFLKESYNIWENCRIFNGNINDGFYTKAANDSEKFFSTQIMRIKDYGLTSALYRKILGIEEEFIQIQQQPKQQQQAKEPEYTVQNITSLVKKLQELPELYMLLYLKEFCIERNLKVDFDTPEFKINFSAENGKELRALEQKVQLKLQEIKDKKSKKSQKTTQ